MKKLLFLIFVCVLSQNFAIASNIVNQTAVRKPPVPCASQPSPVKQVQTVKKEEIKPVNKNINTQKTAEKNINSQQVKPPQTQQQPAKTIPQVKNASAQNTTLPAVPPVPAMVQKPSSPEAVQTPPKVVEEKKPEPMVQPKTEEVVQKPAPVIKPKPKPLDVPSQIAEEQRLMKEKAEQARAKLHEQKIQAEIARQNATKEQLQAERALKALEKKQEREYKRAQRKAEDEKIAAEKATKELKEKQARELKLAEERAREARQKALQSKTMKEKILSKNRVLIIDKNKNAVRDTNNANVLNSSENDNAFSPLFQKIKPPEEPQKLAGKVQINVSKKEMEKRKKEKERIMREFEEQKQKEIQLAKEEQLNKDKALIAMAKQEVREKNRLEREAENLKKRQERELRLAESKARKAKIKSDNALRELKRQQQQELKIAKEAAEKQKTDAVKQAQKIKEQQEKEQRLASKNKRQAEKIKKVQIKKRDKMPIPAENAFEYSANQNEVRVQLTQIEFPESRVFTPEELQQLAAPLLKQPVSITDIKKVVNDITRCYILGDYVTSKAYLPPQEVNNGILKIGLLEGTVGDLKVEGNKWTRISFIKTRLHAKEGDLLKINQLEQDVIKFNNNNTVKLNIGLTAGKEQGETDVVVHAEDPFPIHLGVMTDNAGRYNIGRERFGAMAYTDSFLGLRDKLTLGGYLGSGTRIGFGDYNIPINKYGTKLGFNVSANNIDVVRGPYKPFQIGGNALVYSAYLTHPLIDRPDLNLSTYTSANWKRSTTDFADVRIYETNLFSVTQGFTARKDTEKGIWYTGHYGSAGIKGVGGDENFWKYEGNVTRLHDFGKGIIGQFRVSGQYSPDDLLPWMEQFQIGGISTVRGYSEGLLIGKSGYFASAEIITPLPFLPRKIGSERLGYLRPRDMIKGAVFMDHGMVFPYKGIGGSIDSTDMLLSWGLGLRMNLNQNLMARLYWGFGLKNKNEMDQKMGRLHFEITCMPDFGALLSHRQPKPKKEKKSKKKKEAL